MAGPCLTIYTKDILDEDKKSEIWTYIETISSEIEGENFWISGQPFLIASGEELDEEDKTFDLAGWKPKDIIILCAMCNNQSSHVLLATIAIKVAEITDGMILLECIRKFTHSPAILTLEGHIKVSETDYVVSPGYLGHWLGSGEFRLLK
ncbi:MAG: DUF6368 family protein [Gammaproteobacteria bacterium]|nr:DUF6368 family protein [Gammaproteobacteria bacterium]